MLHQQWTQAEIDHNHNAAVAMQFRAATAAVHLPELLLCPQLCLRHPRPLITPCVSSAACACLQDLFWHVQRSSATPKQPLLRAGWLAFLVVKAQLLPGFPDMVRSVQLWLQQQQQ
jgi:hypothetical protein